MKWIASVLAVVLVASIVATAAPAQEPCPCTAASGLVSSPSIVGEAPVVSFSPAVTGLGTGGQILPYSYYVTAPQPARVYVEYGPMDQFPFYGRAYGNPGDRWSWYYMGGGDRRYLAKYYYPLLR
jgi:hypothetical protein